MAEYYVGDGWKVSLSCQRKMVLNTSWKAMPKLIDFVYGGQAYKCLLFSKAAVHITRSVLAHNM